MPSDLLHARFNAADQGYSDGQALDTVAEGVKIGTLTVAETDGTLAIVSNKCAFTAQSTPAWGALGLYSQGITKTHGYVLECIVNLTTWEEMGIGFDDAATVADPDNMVYALQANTADGQLDVEGGTAIVTGLSTSTDYPIAIVLGGYDSNGVSWYSGETKSSYLYGAAYFYEVGGAWTLIWRKSTDNTGTLYAALAVLDGAGTIDDLRVPSISVSSVLQPAAFSTFTASNGTSLDAITPEVGGTWTEQAGDWEIQGNETIVNAAAVVGIATASTSIADAILDADVTPGVTGTTMAGGPLARYTDTTHWWSVLTNVVDDEIQIWEVNGTASKRAATSVTVDSGVQYAVRMVCYGQTIDGFQDGANKTTYGSAALNETETTHGMRSVQTGAITTETKIDNLAIYARTSDTYDTELDLATISSVAMHHYRLRRT